MLLVLLLLLILYHVLEFMACISTTYCPDDAMAHLVAAISAYCAAGEGAK